MLILHFHMATARMKEHWQRPETVGNPGRVTYSYSGTRSSASGPVRHTKADLGHSIPSEVRGNCSMCSVSEGGLPCDV